MTYKISAIESSIINKFHEELRKKDSFLGQIKTVNIIHSGGIIYSQKENKEQLKSELVKLSSSTLLKNEIIEEYQIEEFCLLFYELIDAQIKATVNMILEETKRITEFTGNVIGMKEGKMDAGKLLEMIKKIAINFDNEGNPILPQIYCGSDMFDQFKDFKFAPEEQLVFDQIIETKKNDWYAKKHYRKLSFIN